MKFFEITKLQAAERQIETAAKLYFNDGDSISVHTLCEAGHQILRDLADAKKVTVPRDGIFDQIKPERRDEFIRKVRAPQNFFKHADRDPDGVLSFNPAVNELSLLYAVLLHKEFVERQPFFMHAFFLYYMIQFPQAFLDLKSDFIKFAKKAARLSKSEFVSYLRDADSKFIV